MPILSSHGSIHVNRLYRFRREHHTRASVCSFLHLNLNTANISSGTRFTLSRDELLTLPEFVLLSLFPNGLLPDGHMNSYHDGDVYPVDVSQPAITQVNRSFTSTEEIHSIMGNSDVFLSDIIYYSQYDPTSLQYMLEFFRNVAQTIPQSGEDESLDQAGQDPSGPNTMPIEPMQGNARDMLQDRAGIIVLREDLDFYCIPPRKDIEQHEMIEVKRAAGKALLKQDGIFSGLRKSEEPGTTEQHLIEMLTAGYVILVTCTTFNPSLTHFLVDSTVQTSGATVPPSPTRLSSAQSRLHACAPTSAANRLPTTTLSAWHKNCFFSGANPPGDAGGRASSLRTSRVYLAH